MAELTLPFLGTGKPKPDDITLFTQELSWMVRAGVPLGRAIDLLLAAITSPRMTPVLKAMRGELRAGARLSDAMRRQEAVFPEAYLRRVALAEQAGTLPRVLARLREGRAQRAVHDEAGLTLAEMLLVLAIMALVAGVVVGPVCRDAGQSEPRHWLPMCAMRGPGRCSGASRSSWTRRGKGSRTAAPGLTLALAVWCRSRRAASAFWRMARRRVGPSLSCPPMAAAMASSSRRSPAALRHCSPEAGFSLVEVLAALAIASLAVVMAMQVLLQSARVDARLTHEMAARDLSRRLMAEAVVGQGEAGVLVWHVALTTRNDGLVLRQVQVSWPGGPVLETDCVEVQP